MRTIACWMELPENASPSADFQTLDLEDYPEGGYAISHDRQLLFVVSFARGRLPDTLQCERRVPFTGTLRFYTSPPEEVHKFVVDLKEGQMVSGPTKV